MNEFRYSRYFYRPKRRRKKALFLLFIILILIGGGVYSVFFVDLMELYTKLVEKYRLLVNDYSFIEKNIQKKNFTIVINEGSPYLAKRPYNARLLRYMGEAYYNISSNLTGNEKQESLEEAIKLLRKALVLSRAEEILPRYYYILGMCYFKMGPLYYELAAQYLEKSYISGYRDKNIYEIIGVSYYKLGAYEKAITYLKKAVEISPKDVNRLFLASAYKEKGLYESAQKEFEYLINQSNDNAIKEEAYGESAWIDFREARYSSAREKLNVILEMDENSAFAHFWLGNIYEKEGDIISARKEWRVTLKIDPHHVGAIKKLY